jgi:two-component system NtrC family sensor kinase
MQKDLPRLIQSCEDGARRTKDIVVGLRNFSRLDEGKFKKMNINESLDQTIRLLSGEFKGQVELHTEFTEVPEVECQAGHINQVFVNIISNAVQSIQGKGDVFIRTRVGPQGATGPTVEISIRDTGHGIDRDTLERIFDPFFTTKAVGEGTGLGLSISYGIVKKHGGEIRVSSEVGKGTEFTIVLPVNRVDHL